jgi:hypothetical protein
MKGDRTVFTNCLINIENILQLSEGLRKLMDYGAILLMRRF